MNKKVQEFFNKKRAEELKAREEVLVELELYEKVYSPDSNRANAEYPFAEHDSVNGSRWYKKQALSVTDEEYEAIRKYAEMQNKGKTNGIALFLSIIAIFIYVMGLLVIFSGDILFFTITVVAGSLILGFAEIIKLLDEIRKK